MVLKARSPEASADRVAALAGELGGDVESREFLPLLPLPVFFYLLFRWRRRRRQVVSHA